VEAHLRCAKLANLLQVVAGVHVSLGKVEIDIAGVEAEAR
jgi:sarcosine oxidase gamma subunit